MIPSTNSPWYIVQYYDEADFILRFYQDPSEAEKMFDHRKETAYVFTSLKSAIRVAEQENAHIRMLINKKNAQEFGVE